MHLWAIGVGDLRLDEGFFYRLTPRQLNALSVRRAREREHAELLAGIQASATANFGFSRPKKALTPADFGLGPRPRSAGALPLTRPPTPQEIHEHCNRRRAMAGQPPLSPVNAPDPSG